MKRLGLLLFVFLVWAATVRAQTAAGKKATIAYLQGLQTKSGGFLPGQPQGVSGRLVKPSLRATTAAVRALKYFGGKVPDRKAAQAFIQSCFLKDQGGFADTHPTLRPDVVSTSIGLLAVVDLQMPQEKYTARGVKYLEEHVRSFEDIRIAAAALEAVHKRPARADAWLKQLVKLRNEDGTFGEGSGAARFTGGAVVTILRLGGKVAGKEEVLKTLRAGQRKDGGFGKEDATGSDLETCYRVVRAFVMLKKKPADVLALRRFVAKCRNQDGGYGVAPGQSSSAAATYFAGIILHWLEEIPARK